MKERIAKYLARAGVCSRREAEELIKQERITVNGETITSPAFFVDGTEKILFDGEKVAVSFNTKTFVDFLNDHVLEEEKSIILKENAFIVSKRIPRLLF